jgi:hypothetical protein
VPVPVEQVLVAPAKLVRHQAAARLALVGSHRRAVLVAVYPPLPR